MKNFFLKIIYKILASYARKVISLHDPFVIAVTGSVGKTSTKEAIYQVLHDKYGDQVRKNYGNLNAEIGIPLTILGYQKLPNKFMWPIFLLLARFRTNPKIYPKYLVLEMGVEHLGDIKYFCSIVRPNIAVVTSTSPAHVVNFESVSRYRDEKLSIIDHMKDDGRAIVNYDDPNLLRFKDDNIVSVSITNGESQYRAENIKLGLSGTDYRICKTGYKLSVKSKLLGKQMIYAQMFALALADLMQMPLVGASKSLEKMTPLPGRLNIIPGKENIVIIDDTYNSNPASAKMAVSFMDEVEYPNRKVAILGNMNELGKHEESSHRELAEFLKGKCDLAIFVGKNARTMQEVFGLRNSFAFATRGDLAGDLDSIIDHNDLILVKASQNNNFLEEIVKKLMKNPNDAGKMLVRQGSEWKGKK